jgi:hypothetical protein
MINAASSVSVFVSTSPVGRIANAVDASVCART